MTIASTSIPDTTGAAPREVVFVDSRVQDVATLLKGFAPGVEVVYLQAGADGLAQMAAALGERGDVATSDNRTGAEGDWALEIATGHIAAPVALSHDTLAAYGHAPGCAKAGAGRAPPSSQRQGRKTDPIRRGGRVGCHADAAPQDLQPQHCTARFKASHSGLCAQAMGSRKNQNSSFSVLIARRNLTSFRFRIGHVL